MFITAAISGAVSKHVALRNPKFISDTDLDNFRVSASGHGSVSETLLRQNWEAAPAGGLLLNSKTAKIPFTLLRPISDRKIQQSLAVILTNCGWQIDQHEFTLGLDHATVETFLPPNLVSDLAGANPSFIQHLTETGWLVTGSGYWNPMRASSPFVPVTPEAIIQETISAALAGASIVHLHTRDLSDEISLTTENGAAFLALSAQRNHISEAQYKTIIPEIHLSAPNLTINVSTSVRGGSDYDSPVRRSHLHGYGPTLRAPEIASFSPGDVEFQSGGGYKNTANFLEIQMETLNQWGIRPEIEIFNHNILENATTTFLKRLEELGKPILFMLVAGVDQYGRRPNGEAFDDSLIPKQERQEIFELIVSGDGRSLDLAIARTVSRLKSVVGTIRDRVSSSQISLLLPGPMLHILAEVAVQLQIDGVRVGLEDALNVPDSRVPGGIRRAKTSEQVRYIRRKLEQLNVSLLTPDETRHQLQLETTDVKLYTSAIREAGLHLEKFDPNISISAKDICNSLTDTKRAYISKERRFANRLHRSLAGRDKADDMSANTLGAISKQLIDEEGLWVRYFVEERDRYPRPIGNFERHVYILQSINFAKEILDEYGFDSSLLSHSLKKLALNHDLKDDSYLIDKSLHKGCDLRFLEYLTSVPCRYNRDRTIVINTQLRNHPGYSRFQALLFSAINSELVRSHGLSSAEAKHPGSLFVEVSPRSHAFIDRVTFVSVSRKTPWIVLPSTPTTHYEHGVKLAIGLTTVFAQYLSKAISGTANILGIVHPGQDETGRPIIESAMLQNRYTLNADKAGSYIGFPAKLHYESIFLDRVIENPERLRRRPNGMVDRDTDGRPLYVDGNPATRIASRDIDNLRRLHFFAHSSGIATMQQIDNAAAVDLRLLRYSDFEIDEIYNRSIVFSFGSASDINTSARGTPVVDITASNDIRSIAGTTTPDYILRSQEDFDTIHTPERKKLLDGHKYSGKWKQYKNGTRRVLRLHRFALTADPARLHDGHSIKRYLDESPLELLGLVDAFHNTPANVRSDMILREFIAKVLNN